MFENRKSTLCQPILGLDRGAREKVIGKKQRLSIFMSRLQGSPLPELESLYLTQLNLFEL